MDASNIIGIEPQWNLGYSNSPEIVVSIDCDVPLTEDCVWVKDYDGDRDITLITTTFAPFVRFVHIEDPNGDPLRFGALGGAYRLEDGTVLRSRSGWSSRVGVINLRHNHLLPDELAGVTIRTREGGHLGGWSLSAKALAGHPLWPEGCYLVRELLFRDDEPYWHISTSEDRVTKPSQTVPGRVT